MDHGIPIEISSFLDFIISSLSSINIAKLLCIRIYQTFIQIIFLNITSWAGWNFFLALLGAGTKAKQIPWKGTVSDRKHSLFLSCSGWQKIMQQKRTEMSWGETVSLSSYERAPLFSGFWTEFFKETLSSFPWCNQLKR